MEPQNQTVQPEVSNTADNTELSRKELKEKRLVVPITELRAWDKNPRAIEKADYERLKKRVKGPQFKPLLVMADGVVLGGNMRLRAMTEVGKKEVWVSIIEFVKQGENRYVPYINGEIDLNNTFESLEDGMVHYAITDNEEFGKYMELQLQEQLQPLKLDLAQYKLNLSTPRTLLDIKNAVNPDGNDPTGSDEDDEDDEDNNDPTSAPKAIKVIVHFPDSRASDADDLFSELQDRGLTVRLKR